MLFETFGVVVSIGFTVVVVAKFGSFLVVLLILTVEVIVVVSTLQLLLTTKSILLKTVLVLVVISVVVVEGVVDVLGTCVVVVALVGTELGYSFDMTHANFIELPDL